MNIDEIQRLVFGANSSPIDDFSGLAPAQMHQLLYSPFDEDSVVQLNREIEFGILDQIPLFRIAEEYLQILQREKFVKQTPLGALPKKVLVEVYSKRILLDDAIESGITKLTREYDFIELSSARLSLQLAGLVRLTNGKLFLTKKAEKLLSNNGRQELFQEFFKAFTQKFLWSSNDRCQSDMLGQTAWAFSVYLMHKFGVQQRKAVFYVELYRKAFPQFLAEFSGSYSPAERQFAHCYEIRTFSRFMEWFGFIEVTRTQKFSFDSTDLVKQSGIFTKVFSIKTK